MTPRGLTHRPRSAAIMVAGNAVLGGLGLPRKHGLKKDAAGLEYKLIGRLNRLGRNRHHAREPERSELAAGCRIRDNDTFQRAGGTEQQDSS